MFLMTSRHQTLRMVVIASVVMSFLTAAGYPAAWADGHGRHGEAYHWPTYHRRPVARLPHGYRTIRHGHSNYYFHGGIFYERGPLGFLAIAAPIGLLLATLPFGYSTIVLHDRTYYYYGDTYYQRVPSGYEVVEPPARVLTTEEPPPVEKIPVRKGMHVTVNARQLNIRSGPGMEFESIYRVAHGTLLEVLGQAPDWLYVRLGSDQYGWVKAEFTAPVEGSDSPASG
jgi:Family of unknown function (DUF6515)/Bacterial SH3 domain